MSKKYRQTSTKFFIPGKSARRNARRVNLLLDKLAVQKERVKCF